MVTSRAFQPFATLLLKKLCLRSSLEFLEYLLCVLNGLALPRTIRLKLAVSVVSDLRLDLSGRRGGRGRSWTSSSSSSSPNSSGRHLERTGVYKVNYVFHPGGGGIIKSVGEEYHVVKRGREYHSFREEYNVEKRERGSNIIFPLIVRL